MFAKFIALRPLGVLALLALSAPPVPPAAATTEDAQGYAKDAQQMIAKGDLRGAEIQLRNAVRANPNDASLHVELGKLYLKIGNLPAAEVEAREARRAHGSDDAADAVLAEALLRQNKMTQLFQLIQPGNRAAPDEAEVRLALGQAHLGLGEVAQAEPLLRDAERLDDQSVGPKLAVARLLAAKGDLDGAEAELDKARKVAPDNSDITLLDGQILYSKHDDDGALARFNALLAKNPDDTRALINRASLYLRKNDTANAGKDLAHALKIAPQNPMAIYLDSILLAKEGDLKQADDMLSKIEDLFSSMPAGYYLQGQVKYSLGQYEQADASLAKYIARNPDDAGARQLSATIALRKRDPAGAIRVLQPVIAANPGDVATIAVMARAYLATGQRDQALALYENAAKAKPDSLSETRAALAKMQLGEAADGIADLEKLAQTKEAADIAGPELVLSDLRDGRLDEAATTAEGLVQRNGKDIVAQNLLGVVRASQRNYADAVKIFKDIAEKNPTLQEAQRNLAKAYDAMKDTADAKTVWQKLLKAKPDDVDAMVALARFDARDKDFGGAAELLEKAQQAAAKDPAPGLQLIELYAQQKDWDKAKLAGRDLEGQFPSNPDVIDMVAKVKANAGDAAGAAAEFGRLTEALPNSADIWMRYAAYQFAAGDKDGARQSVEKALAIDPANYQDMERLVDLDYLAKGPEAALKTAGAFAPKQQVAADLLTSEVLVRAGRSADALKGLTQAQEQHPAIGLVMRIAELTYAAGQHQEAERQLEAWLKSHDDAVAVRMGLANYYILESDDDKAQAIYERVLQQDPKQPLALNNLAEIYFKKHDPRAAGLAERAYALAPQPSTADTLGWVLVGNGNSHARLVLSARGRRRLAEAAGRAIPPRGGVAGIRR